MCLNFFTLFLHVLITLRKTCSTGVDEKRVSCFEESHGNQFRGIYSQGKQQRCVTRCVLRRQSEGGKVFARRVRGEGGERMCNGRRGEALQKLANHVGAQWLRCALQLKKQIRLWPRINVHRGEADNEIAEAKPLTLEDRFETWLHIAGGVDQHVNLRPRLYDLSLPG